MYEHIGITWFWGGRDCMQTYRINEAENLGIISKEQSCWEICLRHLEKGPARRKEFRIRKNVKMSDIPFHPSEQGETVSFSANLFCWICCSLHKSGIISNKEQQQHRLRFSTPPETCKTLGSSIGAVFLCGPGGICNKKLFLKLKNFFHGRF